MATIGENAPNVVEDGGIGIENGHVGCTSCAGSRYGFIKCGRHRRILVLPVRVSAGLAELEAEEPH